MSTLGLPRNLGGPVVSRLKTPVPGTGRTTVQAYGRERSACRWSELKERNLVPPNEGNEVRRNGRQGVRVPHSTGECGEPTHGTRWREGGTE